MISTDARALADRLERVMQLLMNSTEFAPLAHTVAECQIVIHSLADQVEALEGALADIAYSPDMTLKIARAKADRMYKGCAREAT